MISYHTINNFRSSDHANELVKKCFLYCSTTARSSTPTAASRRPVLCR